MLRQPAVYLDRGKPVGREWFIGYEFCDNGEQASTVIDAISEEEALEQFDANYWRIAYGDRSNRGPPGVDAHNRYEIIEVRPATNRDRRPAAD